jgi:hypothetical protein
MRICELHLQCLSVPVVNTAVLRLKKLSHAHFLRTRNRQAGRPVGRCRCGIERITFHTPGTGCYSDKGSGKAKRVGGELNGRQIAGNHERRLHHHSRESIHDNSIVGGSLLFFRHQEYAPPQYWRKSWNIHL